MSFSKPPKPPVPERRNPRELAQEALGLAKDAIEQSGAVDAVKTALMGLENEMGPHVSTISSDLTVSGGPASMSVHQGLAPYPAYDAHFMALNPIDGWMGKRKMSAPRGTLQRMRPIVLQGHEVKLIPHIVVAATPAEGLVLSAKCTTLSSRKCVFGAAKIMVDRTAPLGSCTLLNLPPTPMVFCADPISLPLGDAPTSHFSPVRFHMSMLDYVMGWIEIGVDMIIDATLHALGGDGPTSGDWEDALLDLSDIPVDIAVDNVKNAAEAGVQTAVLYAYDASNDPHEPQYRSVEWSLDVNVFGLELHSQDLVTVTKKQKPDVVAPMTNKPSERVKGLDANEKPVRDLSKWGPVL